MKTSLEISAVCRQLLDENRERLNAGFLQRKRAGAKLDREAWLGHLQKRVLPLVDRIHEALPERGNRALNELYDVSLDLFVGGHFAETTGLLPRVLAQLWEQTLPRLAPLIARDPRRVSGSLSNAVLAIAQAQPMAVQRWLTKLDDVGASAESVEQLLNVGQVAAWVAGLPQYRLSAVGLAQQLPPGLVRTLLDLPASAGAPDIQLLLRRFLTDGWTDGRDLPVASLGARVEQVACCGDFRGFGGQFLYPPQVFLDGNQLYVTDTHQVWQLQADRFGHALHRSDIVAKINKRKPTKEIPQIDNQGVVHWHSEQVSFPHLQPLTSQAFDGRTLAVTLADSFRIYLIARYDHSGGVS